MHAPSIEHVVPKLTQFTEGRLWIPNSLVDIILLHKQWQWLSEWWGMLKVRAPVIGHEITEPCPGTSFLVMLTCKLCKHRPTYLTYNIFLAISLSVPRAGLWRSTALCHYPLMLSNSRQIVLFRCTRFLIRQYGQSILFQNAPWSHLWED